MRASPKVMSTGTSIEKNSSEIEAEPWTCHGVGASMVRLMPMPNTPSPNTLTEKEVENSTMNMKGENWISASSPAWPSTDSAEKPKNISRCAPNWTVLLVTAK